MDYLTKLIDYLNDQDLQTSVSLVYNSDKGWSMLLIDPDDCCIHDGNGEIFVNSKGKTSPSEALEEINIKAEKVLNSLKEINSRSWRM